MKKILIMIILGAFINGVAFAQDTIKTNMTKEQVIDIARKKVPESASGSILALNLDKTLDLDPYFVGADFKSGFWYVTFTPKKNCSNGVCWTGGYLVRVNDKTGQVMGPEAIL